MKHLVLLVFACILLKQLKAQNGIYITPGAQFVCVGAPVITLKNVSEFVNRGTFIAGNSTVEIQDNSIPTSLGSSSGGSPLQFYNLIINNSKGSQLKQNISVNNNLVFTKGNLRLKNKTIQLASTAVVSGEGENRRLLDDDANDGKLSITQTLTTAPNISPGNLGVKIVSCSSPFGVTTISRFCGTIPINGVTTGVIKRYYKIEKQFNTGLNARINFSYLNAELQGISPSTAVLWSSSDNGVSWASTNPDLRNTTSKFLQKGGMNSFATLWTIGSPTGSRMPMIVQAINVKGTDEGNALTWSIEEDYPFDYFIVEKSKDLLAWNGIGSVGANEIADDYQFDDPFTGEAYYRLKQFDKDGAITYSKVVKSSEPINNVSILIYPNPARNSFNVKFSSAFEGKSQLCLISASGELVRSTPVSINKGSNNINMNVRGLSAGTYIITIKEKGIDFKKRVVIE